MNSLSWSLFVPTLATSVNGGGKVSSSPCVAMNEHWCSAHSPPFMVDLKVWAIWKCSWYISCVRRKHTSLGISMPLILKLPVTEVCRGESKLGRWKCITNVRSCFTHFSLSHLGQLLSRPPVCLRTQQNNGSRSSVDDFTDFPQAPAMLESAKKMINLLLKIDFDIIQTNLKLKKGTRIGLALWLISSLTNLHYRQMKKTLPKGKGTTDPLTQALITWT